MQGTIIEIRQEGANRVGLVEFDGKRRAVYLTLIPSAAVGDEVLFHAGFATERIRQNGPGTAHPAAIDPVRPGKESLETSGAYRLLSQLDPGQLRKLIELAQDRHYNKGEIIFPSGATSAFLHLVVSGDVALEAVTDGLKHQVQTLHSGDAMGWSAISGDSLTHFQARTLSTVTTVAFLGTELRASCDADPALGYALMKRLVELASERLDAMRVKLAERSLVNAAG
jgi:CRP-like cAMP-binding protein/hydrogenase maturation factor